MLFHLNIEPTAANAVLIQPEAYVINFKTNTHPIAINRDYSLRNAMLRRVLLVEDHDSLRCLLGSFLSDSFDVVSAKNGLEAMTWLYNGLMPDVIVTDNDMPELDGLDLLRQLRCTGLWSDIPVVVLGKSTNSEQESQRFKNLGAQDFVKKPFSPHDLQAKLLRITELNTDRLPT